MASPQLAAQRPHRAPAPRIALDIDNVLGDIITAARLRLAREHQFDENSLEETFLYKAPIRMPNGEAFNLSWDFWQCPEMLLSVPPVTGAVLAVQQLYEAGMLAGYVTRRSATSHFVTREWLTKHDFPIAPLRCVGTDDPETAYANCKSAASRELGAAIILDDSPNEVRTARMNGFNAQLIDPPIGRSERMALLEKAPHIPVHRTLADAGRHFLQNSKVE